jgi:DNA-binding beta-propeller fold protein YncE
VTDGAAQAVRRIDPESLEEVASIPLGGSPHGIVADGSDIWVANLSDDTVQRIDADRNEVVEEIDVGVPGYALAIHGNTLWVSCFDPGTLVRVDLETREVVGRVQRRIMSPTGIVAAEDGVWVPLHFSGLVARVDPQGAQPPLLIDTRTAATEFIGLAEEDVWVTTGDRSHEIVAISRETNEVTARIPAEWPHGVTVHDGIVWVADSGDDDQPQPGLDDSVIAIDATTREVIRRYPLPGLTPYSIAVDDSYIWVTVEDEDPLIRLDNDV